MKRTPPSIPAVTPWLGRRRRGPAVDRAVAGPSTAGPSCNKHHHPSIPPAVDRAVAGPSTAGPSCNKHHHPSITGARPSTAQWLGRRRRGPRATNTTIHPSLAPGRRPRSGWAVDGGALVQQTPPSIHHWRPAVDRAVAGPSTAGPSCNKHHHPSIPGARPSTAQWLGRRRRGPRATNTTTHPSLAPGRRPRSGWAVDGGALTERTPSIHPWRPAVEGPHATNTIIGRQPRGGWAVDGHATNTTIHRAVVVVANRWNRGACVGAPSTAQPPRFICRLQPICRGAASRLGRVRALSMSDMSRQRWKRSWTPI